MRRFIVFCCVLIITLTFFSFNAFADDPEESISSGDRLATEEEMQQLDDELHSTSVALYNLLSDNGTKATTHDVNDIYNWLNSYFGAGFGSYTTSYPTLAYSRLGQIITELRSINTSISNISTKSTLIYETVENIFNGLNPEYDDLGISIYDLLHSVVTALTTIDPDDGDLTLVETLVYMYNELEDINTNLNTILNSSYSIDNKLTSIYAYLANFRSDMNTGFTNVNSNMALIISRLQSMQEDFNNISWLSLGTSSLYYSDDTIINSTGNLSQLLVYSYIPYFNLYTSLIKVDIPLLGNVTSSRNFNIDDVYITTGNSNAKIPVNYYVVSDSNRFHTYIYIYGFGGTSTNNSSKFKLFIKTKNLSYYNADLGVNFYYITADTIDYLNIYNWLINRTNHQIMDKLQLLYASDDLIDAKQDQQAYEDQAIQDFTGSGSAAASGQDLGDMKSISGAIKSGLQTGGSVNNALAPFNTNSGFWGWFSQSNYDNINNIPSSGTRSGNSSQPDIIDFYTNNQYTLQGLLSGGGN